MSQEPTSAYTQRMVSIAEDRHRSSHYRIKLFCTLILSLLLQTLCICSALPARLGVPMQLASTVLKGGHPRGGLKLHTPGAAGTCQATQYMSLGRTRSTFLQPEDHI